MKAQQPVGGVPDEQWRAWMAAAQGGDRKAYEQLLRALLAPLRNFIRRRVSDPAAGEDLVQEVLFSIHRARHTFRPERPFAPWWRAIARNAIVDWLRKQGRRREQSLEGVELADESRIASDTEALSPELVEALEALPPNQRQAVELIHVHGLSVAEAAAQAGVTAGALKVRAHRGYKALRQRLERAEW